MGTSALGVVTRLNSKDHPHAYGDKTASTYGRKAEKGSSPRVWGQERLQVLRFVLWRIIPTRMGTRMVYAYFALYTWDHPHAYGDKRVLKITQCRLEGSSPRVWGQAFITIFAAQPTRIIPTRMGTSSYLYLLPIGLKDHPHAYGDKPSTRNAHDATDGSSPRVWGQVGKSRSEWENLRIIPTRMGTSRSDLRKQKRKRDHPHAYGDKFIMTLSPIFRLGSSPRVWGQVVRF